MNMYLWNYPSMQQIKKLLDVLAGFQKKHNMEINTEIQYYFLCSARTSYIFSTGNT